MMVSDELLESYWSDIPVGKVNAWSYDRLCDTWGLNKRETRRIMHELSSFDNGDGLILIRSSKSGGGFYRTDDIAEIQAYRAECLNRGRNTLAPLRKIDRVLAAESAQLSMTNNLRAVRVSMGLTAADVCRIMQTFDPSFDPPTLSKMENDRCLPTLYQLAHLAAVYHCTPHDLLDMGMYEAAV